MTWTDILKRPNISMPDYDRNFEYDPEMLERLVKDWDKNNPAKVLYIEAPSTPEQVVQRSILRTHSSLSQTGQLTTKRDF
jgi:hypothetical protein